MGGKAEHGLSDVHRRRAIHRPRETTRPPVPASRDAVERVEAMSASGKKFAQIRAIGLVRREIRRPSGKFFLGAVQAVRRGRGGCCMLSPSSRAMASRTTSKKKKRVLPMFFFRRVSADHFCHFHDRHAVGVGVARWRRPSMAATEKKLREGVDTLKNRD